MELNVPKFKQTFDVRYEFYNDNKIVKAFIKPKKNLGYLWADLRLSEDHFSALTAECECKDMYSEWDGRAVLKPGDTVDIETAKRIALKKAMRSYYNEVKWRYREVWEKIARIAAERLAYIEKVETKASDLTLEIVEMTKEGK